MNLVGRFVHESNPIGVIQHHLNTETGLFPDARVRIPIVPAMYLAIAVLINRHFQTSD